MKNIKEMYDYALKSGELFDVSLNDDVLDIRSKSGFGVELSISPPNSRVCAFRYYDTIKSEKIPAELKFIFFEDIEDVLSGFIAAGPSLVDFDFEKTKKVLTGFVAKRFAGGIAYSNKDIEIIVRFTPDDHKFIVSLVLEKIGYNGLDIEINRHKTGSPYLGVIWMYRRALSASKRVEKKSAALISFVEMLRVRNMKKGIGPQLTIEDETADIPSSMYEIESRLDATDRAKEKEKDLRYITTTMQHLFSKYKPKIGDTDTAIIIEDLLEEPNKSVNVPYLEEAMKNCSNKFEIELDYCKISFYSDFEIVKGHFFIRYTATKKQEVTQ